MKPHPSAVPESVDVVKGRLQDTKARTNFWLDLIIVVAAIGDVLCFIGAMLLAFYGRRFLSSYMAAKLVEFPYPLSYYSGHFIFGIFLYLALAGRTGMYSPQNFIRLRQIFIGAMNAVIIWALFYVCLSLLFSFQPKISRLFVIFSAIFGFAFVIYWRVLFRLALNHNGILKRLRQRLVIVGWNVEVDRLARVIMNDAFHPYEIAGCLPSAHDVYRLDPPHDIKKLGNYRDLADIHKRDRHRPPRRYRFQYHGDHRPL